MRFRVLGPLAIGEDATSVSLGGVKQRATLGFLLLHANQVVASSALLRALWFNEEQPATARKILHNAVWRLRATLAATVGCCQARLSTRPSGYVLQVDPGEVDLLRFRAAVAEGRKKLADHDAESAAALLGSALKLWRGPVLADLVDQGLSWPELRSVDEARWDAQEDWFDAELCCGRHNAIVGDLHTLVNRDLLRERACGQLMLALYRCGRQAEALALYAGMRGRLVELGLEPGQDLRQLQHAILNQDPALTAPSPPVTIRQPTPWATAVLEPSAPARPEPVPTLVGSSRGAGASGRPGSLAPALIPHQRGADGRRQVSVLMVCTAPAGEAGLEHVDEILAATAADVRALMERAGGVPATTIGSMSVAVFGLPIAAADDADRAVSTAVAIRDRFGPELVVSAAVTTGTLRLSDTETVPKVVTGVLADRCQQLVSGAGVGEIWVCSATRHATNGAVIFRSIDAIDDCWLVRAIPSAMAMLDDVPLADRESEMTLAAMVLARVRHRNRPHLLTILGDAGTGKTRLLAEVHRRFCATALPTDLPLTEWPAAVHAALLGARCGISPNDRPAAARAKLAVALGDRPAGEENLVERVLPLWDRTPASPAPSVLAAWAQTMTELHRNEPLVVTVDDLHSVGAPLLDAVRDLVTTLLPMPLCVVVSARPLLLARCPDWGGGVAHSVTITLDPPANETQWLLT